MAHLVVTRFQSEARRIEDEVEGRKRGAKEFGGKMLKGEQAKWFGAVGKEGGEALMDDGKESVKGNWCGEDKGRR